MLLTKEQILNAKDLPTQTVEVPEWGGSVIVRTMTGEEKEAITSKYIDVEVDDDGNRKKATRQTVSFSAALVAFTVVDGDGKQLFTDADIVALGKKSSAALDRVAEAASKLSRLTKRDRKALEKNSGATPNDSSGSA